MKEQTDRKSPCPQCEAQKALMEAGSMPPGRIEELADSLNSESAADPAIAAVDEQKRRREICRQCESLTGEAMCSWCGCYVALRARGAAATCPYPGNDKWKSVI